MLDHEVCQSRAIEKHHTLGKVLYKLTRLSAESRSGHEYAFGCAEPHKAAHKGLYIRATDCVSGHVALGLDVDAIKSQPIFVDHAVDATITRPAQLGSGVLV